MSLYYTNKSSEKVFRSLYQKKVEEIWKRKSKIHPKDPVDDVEVTPLPTDFFVQLVYQLYPEI